MIDTSVIVAGLVGTHVFHERARPHVLESLQHRVPGIVLSEAWAVMRRAPLNLDVATVGELLRPWASGDRIQPTAVEAYIEAFRRGPSLNLGGGIHDLVIAYTCAAAGLPLITLDRRQAGMAREIPGLEVTLLLPDD